MSLISVSQLGALRTLFPDKKIGVAFSCFDLFHAGHVLMLKDSKSQCDILVIGFQTDPTVNRPHKNKPVQSVDERRIQIQGSKYIDYIVEYCTEDELMTILLELNPHVRILGDDYIGKPFTGDQLPIEIVYHIRSTHEYSTTNLRKRVALAEKSRIEKEERMDRDRK